MKVFISTALFVGLLSACTIKQDVNPVEMNNTAEVCIVENRSVREGFLAEMEKVFTDKQINYRVVDSLTIANGCDYAATYTANWRWDLALYMVYAEIKVYQQGSLDGEAIYDARSGGGNMNKFIDAEPKIRELIEQLIQQKQNAGVWKSLKLDHVSPSRQLTAI
ncbi:Sbal_3080 family lipoprotein [Shewanella olleyana]|uniref:Sbal_3080 family lipoprotein n=1 Tax=Shewanella olleyana TaxID=135626 RepID=UPI00200F288A|nr:Sbal_3080 family lipoprotein [Shewanella olleyana]MCL1068418.1 Sbal_3080 family lipoprotein [Shewanella olleyana]